MLLTLKIILYPQRLIAKNNTCLHLLVTMYLFIRLFNFYKIFQLFNQITRIKIAIFVEILINLTVVIQMQLKSISRTIISISMFHYFIYKRKLKLLLKLLQHSL